MVLGLLTCAALPHHAMAAAAPVQGFAEAALDVRWSLPPEPQPMGSLPGPRLIEEVEAKGTPVATAAYPTPAPDAPQAAEADALGSAPTPTRIGATSGLTTYELRQPYRMPADIKRLEFAYQVLNAMDGATTVACLKRDDCEERNPIYGKRPKTVVVLGAKAISGAVHYWVTRTLAPEHPGAARLWGWFSMTLQGSVVGINMSQLF